jgi:hypothetical protein
MSTPRWWSALPDFHRVWIAAFAFVTIGAVLGESRLWRMPRELQAMEARYSPLPGRIERLEQRAERIELRDARQDSLLLELADGRRFNTCLALSATRGYDPAICEQWLPNADRFIPPQIRR